jgi:hypothetical protein
MVKQRHAGERETEQHEQRRRAEAGRRPADDQSADEQRSIAREETQESGSHNSSSVRGRGEVRAMPYLNS